MPDTLIVPIHGPSATMVVPMARHIGPDKIILVHQWPKDGEADRNCRLLADHFTILLKEEARKGARRGKIQKDTIIEVRPLGAYGSMELLSGAFTDLLLEDGKSDSGNILHVALIDEIPMGYVIATFSASPIIPIHAYTAQVGYDIRRQHTTKFQPGLSMDQTIQELPLLNQIADSIRWLNKNSGSSKVLVQCYEMLSEGEDLSRWFKSKEVVDYSSLRQNVISNHIRDMSRRGEGLNLIVRRLKPSTDYQLTPLGKTVAPFIVNSK